MGPRKPPLQRECDQGWRCKFRKRDSRGCKHPSPSQSSESLSCGPDVFLRPLGISVLRTRCPSGHLAEGQTGPTGEAELFSSGHVYLATG